MAAQQEPGAKVGSTNTLRPGPWFNIKMSFCQYRKSHCGDKTVVRSSYLHNGISYTGKMASFLLNQPPGGSPKYSFKICVLQKSYFLSDFKLKLRTCAHMGAHTKFQLGILTINVISGIVYFHEIILESSWNISETTPWTKWPTFCRRQFWNAFPWIFFVVSFQWLPNLEWNRLQSKDCVIHFSADPCLLIMC